MTNYSAMILFLFLGFIFLAIGQTFIAVLFLIGMLLIIATPLIKEIEGDLEKAEGQYPKETVVVGMFNDVGKKAGEFSLSEKGDRKKAGYHETKYRYMTHEPYKGLRDSAVNRKAYLYKSSKPIKGVGESAKSIVETFKKLFE